jgi:hypothetical protein
MNEVVGGIYSPQPLPSRWWRLLAMGAPDSPVRHRTTTVHCPVRATSVQSLGFVAVDRWRCLSSSCTGQSGATPDSPVPSDFCSLTSVAYCSSTQSTVSAHYVESRCFADSPDSPVAHRTVRWIIVECASKFPRVDGLGLYGPGAPDSVRCAKFQHTQVLLLQSLIVSLTEILSWFVLNLMHLR